jgi:hypothetical protein
MTDKYVVEIINGCCFQHESAVIRGRYTDYLEAMQAIKMFKKLSLEQMLEKHNNYVTAIRLLDVTSYPPKELYVAEAEEYMYELKPNDVPNWSEEHKL